MPLLAQTSPRLLLFPCLRFDGRRCAWRILQSAPFDSTRRHEFAPSPSWQNSGPGGLFLHIALRALRALRQVLHTGGNTPLFFAALGLGSLRFPASSVMHASSSPILPSMRPSASMQFASSAVGSAPVRAARNMHMAQKRPAEPSGSQQALDPGPVLPRDRTHRLVPKGLQVLNP